jgi:cytochrome P450
MTYQKRITRGDAPSPVGSFMIWRGHFEHDPFATIDALGTSPPYWVEDPNDVDGYWIISRYEDVREALQDAETFSSIDFYIPYMKIQQPLLPAESDPPYTQKLRTVVMPLMTINRVQRWQARMEEVCTQLISGFAPTGRCEVVEQFARVYPITIFLEIYGLPVARREEFRQHATTFLHGSDERPAAWSAILGIVEAEIISKRANPTDDLLSAIAGAQIDGKPIELHTAVSLAATVFLGGLDTLPSNIAWGLRFLAENPEYRRQLVEQPELIPGAVEEFFRLYSVANSQRRVTRNIEFKGANMAAGDRVYVSIASANRDRSVFGDKVDFTRKVNPHLAFATGPHRCLGSHLARHELKTFLETWHKLIPEYRVEEGTTFGYTGGVFALGSLPVVWDV